MGALRKLERMSGITALIFVRPSTEIRGSLDVSGAEISPALSFTKHRGMTLAGMVASELRDLPSIISHVRIETSTVSRYNRDLFVQTMNGAKGMEDLAGHSVPKLARSL